MLEDTRGGVQSMRLAGLGQAVFAITMTGLGVVGLLYPDFLPLWNPVPATLPAHQLFLHVSAVVSLVAGISLLVRRTRAIAASLLLVTILLWLLLFRLANFLHPPLFGACWSVFPLLVVLAAALVLYVQFAADGDRKRPGFLNGTTAIRIARVLYACSLIFFGAAHFIDLPDTLTLIPKWLPGHLFWAYFTGCTFIAAGLSVLTGIYARVAAALAAVQIGSFLLLVWIPIVAAGSRVAFQWSETILNAVLLAAAWVIADSYWHVKPVAVKDRQL